MSKIEIFSFIFIDFFIDFKELCCISLRSSTKIFCMILFGNYENTSTENPWSNPCTNVRIRPSEQISVITNPDTERAATPWSLTTYIRNGVLRPMVHGHDQTFSSNVTA